MRKRRDEEEGEGQLQEYDDRTAKVPVASLEVPGAEEEGGAQEPAAAISELALYACFNNFYNACRDIRNRESGKHVEMK